MYLYLKELLKKWLWCFCDSHILPWNIRVLEILKRCAPRLPYTRVWSSFFSLIAAPGEQHPSLGTCLINVVISCSKKLNGTLTSACAHIKRGFIDKIYITSHHSCTICSWMVLYFFCRWPQTAGWHLGMTVTLFTRFYQTRFDECLYF